MSNPRRIARAAQRRRLVRTAIRVGGPSLLAASLAALILLIVDRAFDSPAPDVVLLVLPIGVASAVIAIFVRTERTNEERAAAEIDRALGLKDRLSIGIALSESESDDPFSRVAQADASDAAEKARLREAMPIRAGWTWAVWPIGFVLAAVVMVYMPALRTSDRRAAQEAETAANEEQASTVDVIRETADEIEETLADSSDDRVRQRLEELDEIANQLQQGGLEPDFARAKAAESLQAAADDLDRDAEAHDAMTDELRDRLQSLEESTPESPVAPLRDALRNNDLDEARRAADEIEQRLQQAQAEERERIAQELEALAEEINEATPPSEQTPQPPDDQQTAPSEQQSQTDPQSEDQEPTAEDLAREQMENLRDALREASRLARETPHREDPDAQESVPPAESTEQPQADDSNAPPENNEQQPQADDSSTPPENTEQQPQSTPTEPTPRESTGTQPNEQGTPEQSAQSESDPDAPSDAQSGEESGSQDSGEGQQQSESPTESAQPQPADGEQPEQTQAQEEGGTQPGEQQQQEGSPAEGQPSPDGQEQGAPPQEQEGNEQPGQQPTADDFERVREAIERMAEERGAGDEQRRDAEELREQAERILDQMSPEQQEQMRKWGEQLAQESGQDGAGAGAGESPSNQSPEPSEPYRTEDFDPGGESTNPDGRSVARWFTEDEEAGTGERRLAPEGRQQLRDAADAAEKAVEDQAVPNRYRDAVKRYFDRLRTYTEESPDAPPPPASDVPADEGSG